MKSKSRTFYRYILSYALVLILPVALLFLFSYSFLLNRYSQEIAGSNAQVLSQMQESLDTQLEQLINISYMIQNNSVVNLRTNAGDVVAAREAVQTLGMYNSVATLPDVIITYRSGTDYCFTSTARIRYDKLFSEQLAYASHTTEDFLRTVDRPESIVVWPVDTVRQFGGQEAEYITLFVSMTGGIKTPRLRTAYLIPASRIRQSVEHITGDYAGTVQITDAQGELLLGIGPVTREEYLRSAPDAQSGKTRIQGETYLTSTAHSSVVGWDYTVLIPARVIEAPMYQARRVMILLLIAITAAGGAAVYIFSNRQYKPLQQLTAKALGNVPHPGTGDEMRQVEAVLDALSQESKAYRRTLEESRAVLLQSGLNRLLAGELNPQLREELGRIGLTLNESAQYRVAVLDFERGANPDIARTESFMSSVSFAWKDAALCASLPGEGALAILFSNAGPDDAARDSLNSLKNYLEETCGAVITAGLSLPCPVSEIGTAYSQAVRAMQFKLVRGSGCLVVYSSDLDAAASLQDYPQEQMERLQWYLLQLDAENVRGMLRQILGGIEKRVLPFNMVRMICFDVINMTVRTLSFSRSPQEAPAVQSEMLEQLISFDTVPELTRLLEQFVEETCASVQTMQKNSRDDRMREMKDYIRDNCFDDLFSLQAMADHFGLTPSNLSHYFKNSTGQGILEYVQALRKEEACRLLDHTDEPVQLVGQRVGMPNVSSFIRSFKQQTGMTPGQYRRQARSGAAED